MGVTGCGKTTIGKCLSGQLNVPFLEGDAFHPKENIVKMKDGIPLTDEDRVPWLERLNHQIRKASQQAGAVLSCSALKQQYREMLSAHSDVQFIYLQAKQEMIERRLSQREDHFMPASLVASQFETLEEPTNAMTVDASQEKDAIIQEIMHTINRSDIAVIGLGVMGKSLARNFASRGVRVSVFDLLTKPQDIAAFVTQAPEDSLSATADLKDLVASVRKPRKILLMITAGQPVDDVIEALSPLLDKGDIIIDAGNSHYQDTERRSETLETRGLEFVGLGVSGGEEGALKGPSLMLGASDQATEALKPLLTQIVAKDKEGQSCFVHPGTGGAGHFVKMVHNGVEYGEMQLLAETFALLKDVNGFTNEAVGKTFSDWNQGIHESYLQGISADIMRHRTADEYTLDIILDAAGNKGTGRWVAEAALHLGIPVPTISSALMARYTSAFKAQRVDLQSTYGFTRPVSQGTSQLSTERLQTALYLARLINHLQGMHLIEAASQKYEWQTHLPAVLDAWKGGCIIRSALLYMLSEACNEARSETSLLGIPAIRQCVEMYWDDLREIVGLASEKQIFAPVFTAAYQYLLSSTQAESTANLIQAQRDYFGAHRYKKRGDASGETYHTNWKENG